MARRSWRRATREETRAWWAGEIGGWQYVWTNGRLITCAGRLI